MPYSLYCCVCLWLVVFVRLFCMLVLFVFCFVYLFVGYCVLCDWLGVGCCLIDLSLVLF